MLARHPLSPRHVALALVLAAGSLVACGGDPAGPPPGALGGPTGPISDWGTPPDPDAGVAAPADPSAPPPIDAGVAAPSPDTFAGKRVFVTSVSYNGDLASAGGQSVGREGGDALCTQLAADAKLGGGPFLAWLSVMGKPAAERLASGGPWHLVTGEEVFAGPAALAGAPQVGIAVDEKGDRVGGLQRVWTGTSADGSFGHGCHNWASSYDPLGSSVQGIVGAVGATDGTWTERERINCAQKARLICFEL